MVYLLQPQQLHPIQHSNIVCLEPKDFCDLLYQDVVVKHKQMAVDTETEGFFDFENKVIMLQIGTPENQFVIDARSGVPKEVLKILDLKDIKKLFWNAKFDYKFILHDFNIRLENVYDGFIAELCLQCGLEKQRLSLDDNAVYYLNKKLNKDIRNKFIGLEGKPFTTAQILYGAEDVEVLFKIADKQYKLIDKYNLWEAVNLENEAVLALADMEYNGVPFNAVKWVELAKEASIESNKLRNRLDNYILKNYNKYRNYITGAQSLFEDVNVRSVGIDWNSPTSLVKVFAKENIIIEGVGKEELKRYKGKNELVDLFSEYQIVKKRETTYGLDFLKFINKKTKRIHTNFWPIIDTHRVSSNEPNMQQIPSYKVGDEYPYLACFETDNNHLLVSRDYSGQELRIIAEGSNDELWVNAFNEDRDLHSEVAVLMFGCDIKDVKAIQSSLNGKSYRDVAKNINFGLAYGMSKFRLSDIMGISVDNAEKLITSYFNATKQLKLYFDKCIAYAHSNGYIRSYKPISAIRWLPSSLYDKGAIERRAQNTPIQTTGAMMTKLAMVEIRKYLNTNNLNTKVKQILPVHDAILTECDKNYSEEWAEIMGNIMTSAGKMFINKIPVKSDLTISKYWKK